MSKKRGALVLWLGLGIGMALLAVGVAGVLALRQEQKILVAIQSGELREVSPSWTPRLVLALARQQVAAQKFDDAIVSYQRLDESGKSWRAEANVGLGNLYLHQAAILVEQQRLDDAVPLVELAKGFFRETLRQDSGRWDAKLNFELASRLLPSIERQATAIGQEKPDGDPLWTEVPGAPRGLP